MVKSKVNKESDFIKISSNSTRFVEIGKKIQKGELKKAFYGIDGNVGYHYYRKPAK